MPAYASIRPPALRPGDTVAVVSLSAGLAGELPHRYAIGKRQLAETFGLRVIDAPHATRDSDWLRVNPKARAEDLHWALENRDVHGIISAIGGDDSVRIVPYLDLGLIAAHPKVFTGYSDTTISHLAFGKAGVGSFYGMAVLSTAAENGGIARFSADSFSATVMSTEPVGELAAATEWTEEQLDWNRPELQSRRRRWVPNYGWLWLQGDEPVRGPLMGGCLEVLAMALGTAIWPDLADFDGAVLHLEISEDRPPVSQVVAWIRNFAALGIVARISALLFSRPESMSLRDTLALYEAVRDELVVSGRPDLPFVANLDYGHSSPMGVLPLGRQVLVDPRQRRLSILEPAVC
ncbi:S66 family peptidase [Jatrophihabitans sp.]|uniref:S66 family peptidase n=1 Tax=Jatrophihabitans sp. TaxID=1932789 RepID=UPI002F1D9CC3